MYGIFRVVGGLLWGVYNKLNSQTAKCLPNPYAVIEAYGVE